jgi:nucleotide-binding universal stress UspA family protein
MIRPMSNVPVQAEPRAPVDSPSDIRRILLATDLSAVSDRAVDHAIELAVEHGANLVVLSVVDPKGLRLPGGRYLRRIDQERARVESGTCSIVARARSAGASAAFLVWNGDPADSILDAAAAEKADLIVLGSHRRGRLGRLAHGSISRRVAEQAACDVSIIPIGSPSADSL